MRRRRLQLVSAAAAASLGDMAAAAADVLSIRESGEDLPSTWGTARAAELLAQRLTLDDRRELGAWALSQAAQAWTHLGRREPTNRLESAPPQSVETTVSTTRREVSFSGLYDRLNELTRRLKEWGASPLADQIRASMEKGQAISEVSLQVRSLLDEALRLEGDRAMADVLAEMIRALDALAFP